MDPTLIGGIDGRESAEEIARLREDALRYRWLRDSSALTPSSDGEYSDGIEACQWHDGGGTGLRGKELDAAIDIARAADLPRGELTEEQWREAEAENKPKETRNE